MSILHIRIVELKCPESRNIVNYFFAHFNVDNEFYTDAKLPIDPMNRHTAVLSSGLKRLALGIKDVKNAKLTISLKRHRMLIADDDVGRVQIPLSWFPKNKVVREWFPIASSGKLRSTLADSIKKLSMPDQPQSKSANTSTLDPDGSEKIMMLLDIHIVSKSKIIGPFCAPFAPLKVTPGWARPSLLDHSEFPPIPHICYVTSGEAIPHPKPEVPPFQPYAFINNSLIPVQNTENPETPQVNSSQERRRSNSSQASIAPMVSIPQEHPPIPTSHDSHLPADTPEVIEQYPETMFRPYFAAPQPNFPQAPPEPNDVLPPFMGGNLDAQPASVNNGIPVVAGIQSPYAHNSDDVFRTSEIPNVYYPQVSIMDDEYDDDEPENPNAVSSQPNHEGL